MKIPKFGRVVNAYQRHRAAYPTKLHALFFRLAARRRSDVLDVACGSGKSTEPLVSRAGHVVGCDRDAVMLAAAKRSAKRKKLPITYCLCNAEKLPFPDASFDAVTVGTAFHWFDRRRALSSIARVLRKRGLVFVYWTGYESEIAKKESVRQELFSGTRGWRAYVQKTIMDPDKVIWLLRRSGFTKTGTVRLPLTTKATVEQRLNMYRTMGFYARLSAVEKRSFVRKARALLQQRIAGKEFFTIHRTLFVCYGYKKEGLELRG